MRFPIKNPRFVLTALPLLTTGAWVAAEGCVSEGETVCVNFDNPDLTADAMPVKGTLDSAEAWRRRRVAEIHVQDADQGYGSWPGAGMTLTAPDRFLSYGGRRSVVLRDPKSGATSVGST